jgi:hypothetical protein
VLVLRIEQAPTRLSRRRTVFLSHSSSMSNRPIRANSSSSRAVRPVSEVFTPAAPATSCFFHCEICTACTPGNANCATVCVPWTAARATFALKSALRFVQSCGP